MPTLLVPAADSAIAGILLIPGAACKVIIIQGAERHGEIPGFMACARTGIPVTGINPPGYALYLQLTELKRGKGHRRINRRCTFTP